MSRFWKFFLEILVIVVIMLLAIWLSKVAVKSEFVRMAVFKFGYLGVFLTSIANSLNPVIQIPIISFLPLFVTSGLNKWVIIMIISFAMTLADTTYYILGKLGGKYIHQKKGRKIEGFYKNHQWAPIVIVFFFAAIIPLPNEIVLLPLAFLGHRLIPFMPAIFFGNLVFNILAGQGFLALTQFF